MPENDFTTMVAVQKMMAILIKIPSTRTRVIGYYDGMDKPRRKQMTIENSKLLNLHPVR
jgi:hypothetical protein